MENTTTVKTTPKDFFMHLLAFASLYASIVSFIALIFAYIDVLFPDSLSYNYSSSLNQIRLSSSSLFILFAVFILTSWFLEKEFALNPERRSIKFRKWLIYLTLFAAAVTVIVDLITLIYNFYSGDLTTSFLIKVLAVLISALSVFSYYFKDIKRKTYSKESRLTSDVDTAELSQQRSLIPKIVAWVSSLVVLTVIIAGFFVVGTPSQQRTRRFDEQRVADLQNIQYQIVNYWQSKGKLPKSIDDLKNNISGFVPPVDPETKLAYEYTEPGLNSDDPSLRLRFALCAVFKTDSKTALQTNRLKTAPVYNPYDSYSQNWEHGIGRFCFSRNIDSDLYPIRKPGIQDALYPLMTLRIFKKMREGIYHKVVNQEPGLYISIIFPIVFSFLLTFVVSRAISYLITYSYIPGIYLEPSPGLHIHHFTYGVFIMAAASYLALVFNGPRAKYGIALLFGLGLGLAFDEFGMWLKLRDDELTRWSYDGFNIIIGFFFLLLSARGGTRLLKRLFRQQLKS